MTETIAPLIEPKLIPDGIRLEPGMVLARLEKATARHPERRKIIVLVSTSTVQKPVSAFAPDPWSNVKDVTEWTYVRVKGSTVNEDTHPLTTPGTFGKGRDSSIRKMFRFVGYAGQIRGVIDWDRL